MELRNACGKNEMTATKGKEADTTANCLLRAIRTKGTNATNTGRRSGRFDALTFVVSAPAASASNAGRLERVSAALKAKMTAARAYGTARRSFAIPPA